MSDTPLILKPPIQAYLGHRCRVGTFDFTAAVGDFVGTRVVLRLDVRKELIETLESDVPEDAIEWFNGSIIDLEFTDETIAALHAVGNEARCIITLEGAGVPPDLDPLAIFTIKINE
jgi:hypothetical protein